MSQLLQVAMHQDPRDACAAIAAESYKLWLEHENRTDDITIIIVHIRDAQNVLQGVTKRTPAAPGRR
uniref:Uncharacterized protein n=1 Tax=Aegilops tauschii subsp. strangulata TaxID=200361 RepID=A0A453AWL5_AEGTS